MVKFLDLQAQYRSLQPQMNEAIHGVLDEAQFIGGRYTQKFEEAFAETVGVPYCIGVGNGTDALELAIEALDLPPGSEIIVPANTFIASAEAVTRQGHRVVFCDSDPDDYTIDVSSMESVITDRTAAVVVVHLYGLPAAMDEVMAVARRHDLRIVEDCAQAHGARYKGQHVGSLGDVATFSFYPGKIIGAYGDGGAVLTSDENIARHVRMAANHGRMAKYNHEFEGRCSRLDALQAAVLSVKLPHLEEWVSARQRVAARYRAGLASCADIRLPAERPGREHAYHLYVIRTQHRDELQRYLAEQGVETSVHYPTPLPMLPAYAYLGAADANLVANSQGTQLLSLPMGEHLTDAEVDEVARDICEFFAR